jgi:1-aminocyclopropane-1-carboxylate synthase
MFGFFPSQAMSNTCIYIYIYIYIEKSSSIPYSNHKNKMLSKYFSLRSSQQETNRVLSDLVPYFHRVEQDSFNENTNPCGIINLGVAENMLCEQELMSKLASLQAWCPSLNHYGNPLGELSFRQELCYFFHNHLHLDDSIELIPDRMIITGGAASAFVVYSYMLIDRNDVMLIPSPYYSYIDHNVSVVTENQVVRCPLINQHNGSFKLSRESFEHGYNEALAGGLKPTMILLINPNNPLGDVYDEATLLPILQFAAEKCLHVVIDEIYALSTFVTCSFQSILNYKSLLPDPDRTHFLWSFSKDFSLNGARVGVMYTGTIQMCNMSSKINFLFVPSRNVQFMLQQLISDHEWICAYIALNRKRLTQRYIQVKSILETIEGVKVRQSQAGFFIWVDLRHLMPTEATFDDETRLFEHIFDCAGIFILRGQTLGCTQPGWFRIVFSVNDAMIREALIRIKAALTERFCSHFAKGDQTDFRFPMISRDFL